MPLVRSDSRSRPVFPGFRALNSIPCLLLFAALALTMGCGSNAFPNTGGTHFSGNTTVTLLLSSTANDQLENYEMYIQSVTLTSQAGQTAALIASPQPTEFIHLNGLIEPYGTATIPQGIYASATATIGGANFTCMTVQGASDPSPGSLTTSTYAYGYVPDSAVTVNVGNPITITGDTMALQLNLQVSQSASFANSCYTTQFPAPYTITPTFDLAAISAVAQPSNSANGRVMGMVGEIQAIGTFGDQFTLYMSESQRFGLENPQQNPQYSERTGTISVNDNTVYRGISNFAALQAGSFVDLDGAVQPDGSIAASRISVHDPTALNVMFGPLIETDTTSPDLFSFPLGQQGVDYDSIGAGLGVYQYTGNTVFQATDQFNNLGSLPFVPSFAGTNMVPGQNMAIYSQHVSYVAGPSQWTAATTMTLLPQTINGTVSSVNANGYQVQLAPYDLFPAMAIQPGQTNLLTNAQLVEVYTDSNTASLNTTPLTAGSAGRFYGLIFNDNGQLKMDCAQISDGADVTPVASVSSSRQQDELPKVGFRMSADGKQHFYTYTKYQKPGAR
jgi:uncharacterized protein DUF5666